MKNRPMFMLLSLLVLLSTPLARAQTVMPAIPPNILASENLPMVMLTISKDVTMFGRAYTDYEDLDFDGVVDYTFNPAFSYYGYFDASKCYTYSTTNARYEPAGYAGLESGRLYCNAGATTGQWSGNFLNWATMSRIDVLRKVLYGGFRSTDSTTDAVLEMSFVPRNSQAIAKYYNGTDLARLTPYNSTTAVEQGITLCRRPAENTGVTHVNTFTPQIRVAVGNYILWNMSEVRTCNWSTELNYTWKSTTVDFLSANYLTPAGTLGSADPDHVHRSSVPTGGDSYVARVQSCVATLLGNERCKQYGSVWKPIGLLQEFGESTDFGNRPARAEFGLLMGSYDNNLEAGRLRKNLLEISDEINPATGQYLTATSPRTYRGTNGGIIAALDEVTLYGYNANNGNYDQTCRSDDITNGNCSSWGNPVGEMLLESMLYLAGRSATTASGSQTKDNAVGLPQVTTRLDPIVWDGAVNGLRRRSELYGQNICRRLNALTITGGMTSFDDNSMSRLSDLGSSTTAAARTTVLGNLEDVTGTTKLIGAISGGSGADINNLCTGKTVTDLGLVRGVCPDGPNFRGTYLGSGVAHYSNTQRIRSDLTSAAALVPDLPHTALTVKNYGVTMTGGVATIPVAVPGQPGRFLYITPTSIDYLGRTNGLAGNMVDFKVLTRSSDGRSGTVLVLWQHSMLGEDQDQDMLGTIRYVVNDTVSPPTITVYTQTIEADTDSTLPYAFGYTLVGSIGTDGAHFHSSINNFVADATGVSTAGALYVGTDGSTTAGVCVPGTGGITRSLCVRLGATGNFVRGETSKTFQMSGSEGALIKEPLWFMTKYGGFDYTREQKDAAGTGELFPGTTAQWDKKNAAGRACTGTAADPCDGNPDTYFVARRPDLLETALREVFQDIVNTSNTAPAISSSQLRSGELKYVAQFDPSDGRGEIWAYELTSSGEFATTSSWGAHTALTAANWNTGRRIITNAGSSGVAFRWGSIGTGKQDLLKGTGDDAYGQAMLNWLRGDTSDNSQFRKRPSTSVMGSIVNSTPTVQSRPAADLRGPAFEGYGSFVTANRSRESVLWVGAGDGMLHAFRASRAGNGEPMLSYIPEPLFAKLPNWASPTGDRVQAFADGSPFTADVKLGDNWRTYLFSSLGRGGKGIYALDVTDPATFTEANAASLFRWQFTDASATSGDNSGDLGHMVGDPTTSRFSEQAGNVAKLNNGKWAVMFGNGYFSTSGKAALYILFVDGPTAGVWTRDTHYVKLVADNGTDNGLSQPTWVDTDADGLADAVYAGDLKGNVWKFDLSSATPGEWEVALEGRPLFAARDAADRPLAITTAVETRAHPLGGLVVNFSTGRALLAGEFSGVTEQHGIYGVWDKPLYSTASASELDALLPRGVSTLVARTLSAVGTDGSRLVSGGTIDWATRNGWYLPFLAADEMSLANPVRALQSFIVTSMAPPAPKAASTDPDPCFKDPLSWLNVVDPLTGLTTRDVLGSIEITDPVTGVVTTVAVSSVEADDSKYTFGADKTCAADEDCARAVGATSDIRLLGGQDRGRIFWREIPGLRTRAN
jgi:type IV pilus assembly protein PilY1